VVSLVVLLVLTGVVVGGAWYLSRDQPANAKVGDCVARAGDDSLKVVGCSDPDADLTVVGRVDGKTRSEAGYLSTVCEAYESQGAEEMYWEGEQGKKGFVLCLAPHR
jgi:hypothetical protein